MIWHMEVPKYNLYPWFVCELVRKYVKVCLSGNGGDEVLGGYYLRYRNALRIQELAAEPLAGLLIIPSKLFQAFPNNMRTQNRLRVLQFLRENLSEYFVLAGMFPDSFNERLFKMRGSMSELRGHYEPFFRGVDLLQGVMNAELRTKLVDDLLSVDDTMSMANSLELRVPLLDNRIVDLMAAVPWSLKYESGTQGKLLLRKAIGNLLPEESLRKPKWGFSVNVQTWFKGELGEVIHQILPDSDVLLRYFEPRTVRRLLKTTRGTSEDRRFQVLLWQLLGFHFWHRLFIDGDQLSAPNLQAGALVA
jgi:asparagine synthase (glutamine-hydrolysing)